jgi:hypothetical protein
VKWVMVKVKYAEKTLLCIIFTIMYLTGTMHQLIDWLVVNGFNIKILEKCTFVLREDKVQKCECNITICWLQVVELQGECKQNHAHCHTLAKSNNDECCSEFDEVCC